MQRISYTKISSLLVAPALISLLVGCGSPDEKRPSKVVSLNKEVTSLAPQKSVSNNDTTQEEPEDSMGIDPMYIDNNQIKNVTTGTELFDNEDETTDNWVIFDNAPVATVANVDIDGNHAIFLDGTGMKNGFSLRQKDASYINNVDAKLIQWDSRFYDDYIIYVAVKLDDGSIKYLAYRPVNAQSHGDILTFKLPYDTQEGKWTTTARNLEDDLHHYLPERSIASVLDFQVRGRGCIDDIKLAKPEAPTNAADNGGNFDLTISADYAINVSSKVTVSGSGTTINQDALVAQLNADLQNNLQALLGNKAPSEVDPNVQIAAIMQEFESRLDTLITMLIDIQDTTTGNGAIPSTDLTTFNNQMATLLALLTQMQSDMSNPANALPVDLQALMDQFQANMAPLMGIIPQMFSLAEKGMDMMDPEKYIPSMMQMAGEVMNFSKYLVDTTADLIKDPNVDHELYVTAMLRLSDDIGKMADRILVMADKMLVMGDKMQVVAEKMIDMMGTTQSNLLTAQENFNALILGLAGRA